MTMQVLTGIYLMIGLWFASHGVWQQAHRTKRRFQMLAIITMYLVAWPIVVLVRTFVCVRWYMKHMYDNGFNRHNRDIFVTCLASIIMSLEPKRIEEISFAQVYALTLFSHEFEDLYLTFRDAMAMLPDRNKEEDIVKLESFNNTLAGMSYAVFHLTFCAYDRQIDRFEKTAVISTVGNETTQYCIGINGDILNLDEEYSMFSWKRLHGTPVIANSSCVP